MTKRGVLLVVVVAVALGLAGGAALLALSSGKERGQKTEKKAKVADQKSTKAVVKSTGADKKANLSLRLNVKLVRCLTKKDAAALRRCLGLQPGAPGRPGAGGLDGTPGRTGPAGQSLRGPRGLPCNLPECRGPAGADSTTPGAKGADGSQGVAGRPPTDSEIAVAVAAYCAEHGQCRGADGKDGGDGQDSTVPGPAGANGADSTVPGPAGADGAPGAPCPNQRVITTVADGPVTVCVP